MYTLVSTWTAEHTVTFQALSTETKHNTQDLEGYSRDSGFDKKYSAGLRKTLTGYWIWLTGQNLGTEARLQKNDIRDSDKRSLGCGILVKKRAGMRDHDPPVLPDPII